MYYKEGWNHRDGRKHTGKIFRKIQRAFSLCKKEKEYVIDSPIMYSSLANKGLTKEEICEQLCNRINEISKL